MSDLRHPLMETPHLTSLRLQNGWPADEMDWMAYVNSRPEAERALIRDIVLTAALQDLQDHVLDRIQALEAALTTDGHDCRAVRPDPETGWEPLP